MIEAILTVAAEAALSGFIMWGILHERELIAFERRTAARLRRKRSARRVRKAAATLTREGLTLVWRDAPKPERDRSCVYAFEQWCRENAEPLALPEGKKENGRV